MLKELAKRIFRRCGFDIRRHSHVSNEGAQRARILKSHGVNLVFDVGANAGQFGHSLREYGYTGRIVSFEPLANARDILVKTSRNDSLWEVAPRAAIGSENGSISLNVAGNSVSSSVLNMLQEHVQAAPESRYVGTEVVPLSRLDTLAPAYLRAESVVFLKIDTQGYEDRIIAGAQGILDRIMGIQLELSLVALYERQLLFDAIYQQMKERGFEPWAIWPAFINGTSGRLLQADVMFCRPRE